MLMPMKLYNYFRSSASFRVRIALALKGIGRYPELKTGSKVASERFIIGTFVSLLAAAGLAV